MKRIGKYLFSLRRSAEDRNMSKILDMLEENKKAKVCCLFIWCNYFIDNNLSCVYDKSK